MIIKRILFITAGSLSLSLGILGIFLPILPTTPFLLLSAACYLNSSERLYNWLIRHRLFGPYIRGYMEFKAISVRAKTVSIAALWIVIGITVFFFIENPWLKLLLGGIAAGVTAYLLSIKTLTPEMEEKLDRS